MFFYFPVKRSDGAVTGSVRVENGRATLTLSRPLDASFTLFADGAPQPIRPDEPVPCSAPRALLGVQNGSVCAFGTAPGERSTASEFFAKLSQINTKKAEIRPEFPVQRPAEPASSAEEPDENGAILSHMEEDDSDSTAKSPIDSRAKAVFRAITALHPGEETPAPFAEVLKTVHNGDNSVDNSPKEPMPRVQKEDKPVETDGTDALLGWTPEAAYPKRIDLFPRIFPGAVWRFVAQDGALPHFEGLWQHGGERIRILAVRGAHADTPPQGLSGFTRYLRADGAGYWVRLIPMG